MRRVILGWLGAGLAAILGCGPSKARGGSTGTGGASSVTTTSSTASSGGATSSSSSTSSSSGTVMAGDSVLTFHKNPNRDGLYVQPAFTRAAIGTLHRDPSFSATLPLVGGAVEPVYAQPLFVDGLGGRDLVIVVTQNNNVHALDGATGAGVWTANLGPPVPQSALPCGNAFPMGITGTPVVDLASRTLFVDAAVLAGGGAAPPPHHRIFALSIDTGARRSGWPVEANAVTSGVTTFNSAFQGQRGALAILGGTVYVPYGGLDGDCQPQASTGLYPGTAPYHGWVVGVSLTDPTKVSAWATTYAAGGIWTPGGVSSDGQSLFVATGNTIPPTAASPWGGGDALVRLTPSPLALSGYFAPENWYDLDLADGDMGSAPIPFDLAGSTPSTLAILFGKDANAYLVDRTSPGGVGAALGANAALCTPTNTTGACGSGHPSSAAVISAPALYTTAIATYVAGRGQCGTGSGPGDLFTAKVEPGSPPTLVNGWCAVNGAGSPMVTTSDGHSDAIVWDLGAETDDRLHAFDGDTGAAIPFTDSGVTLPGMRRFNTPIAAKGRIFVPVDGGVVAFTL